MNITVKFRFFSLFFQACQQEERACAHACGTDSAPKPSQTIVSLGNRFWALQIRDSDCPRYRILFNLSSSSNLRKEINTQRYFDLYDQRFSTRWISRLYPYFDELIFVKEINRTILRLVACAASGTKISKKIEGETEALIISPVGVSFYLFAPCSPSFSSLRSPSRRPRGSFTVGDGQRPENTSRIAKKKRIGKALLVIQTSMEVTGYSTTRRPIFSPRSSSNSLTKSSLSTLLGSRPFI